MDNKQQKELEKILNKNNFKTFSFEQSLTVGLMITLQYWRKKYKQSLFFYPLFYLLGFITHYLLNLV
tara:strand:+ start:2507 stop:2707 length:201 start_codon:yes stop_codon:yes gene_type:complete